jgi:biopolymer transport protein ExbD
MPIATPRRRLMESVGLSFVTKHLRRGRLGLNARLSLTSMIDFLVVMVVFLLTTFSASGECACARQVDVPGAVNASEMIDAPLAEVMGSQVLVDGAPAGNVHAIRDSRRMQRVDELFNSLMSKRVVWKELHPSREFPGVVILAIDEDVPTLVVKSVFQTAVTAGYPSVSFMVKALPKQ